MNEICNRLCLRKVNSTVEERPLRKLARRRVPRSRFDDCRKNTPGHVGASMAAHFDDIFSCERIRFAEKSRHNLIDLFSGPVLKYPEMRRMAHGLRKALFAPKSRIADLNRFRTADTDDGDAGIADGRRNCSDGIFVGIH